MKTHTHISQIYQKRITSMLISQSMHNRHEPTHLLVKLHIIPCRNHGRLEKILLRQKGIARIVCVDFA